VRILLALEKLILMILKILAKRLKNNWTGLGHVWSILENFIKI
jgi:hypothetical protein